MCQAIPSCYDKYGKDPNDWKREHIRTIRRFLDNNPESSNEQLRCFIDGLTSQDRKESFAEALKNWLKDCEDDPFFQRILACL